MNIKVSTKLFIIALVVYLTSLFCYFSARRVYNEELQKQLPAKLFSLSLIRAPDFNWWHYAASTALCIAVAMTVAGIMLRKSDS